MGGGARCIAALLLLQLIQGGTKAQLMANPKMQVVNPGESASFMCKATRDRALNACTFKINNGQQLMLQPGDELEGVSYSGTGLDQGECGMRIARVEEKHNGNVSCVVWYKGQASSIMDTMKLVVAVKPNNPTLEVHVGDRPGGTSYKERDLLMARCTVSEGRPVANISWQLEEEYITDGVRMPEESCYATNDKCTIQQNLTRTLQASDDKKKLRCVVHHPSLKGNTLIAEHQIFVNYPPKKQEKAIEHFGLVEGMQGRVPVIIEANPKPSITWKVGMEEIPDGKNKGRYTVEPIHSLVPGQYETALIIDTLTKDDTNIEYTVTARNEYGIEHYSVTISTSPEPKVLEIGAGMIIVIVVAIIIIILVLAGVVFARAKGKFCFAVGNAEKRVAPPSEGTENPAVNHHASSEYINNSPELKKEKPKEDTPV